MCNGRGERGNVVRQAMVRVLKSEKKLNKHVSNYKFPSTIYHNVYICSLPVSFQSRSESVNNNKGTSHNA